MSGASSSPAAPNAGGLRLRAVGALASLETGTRDALLRRNASGGADSTLRASVAELLTRVRRDGDAALHAFARDFDRVSLPSLEVPRAEWDAALASLEPALRTALERSVRNIRAVHAAFAPRAVEVSPEPGIVVGRRPDPLARVGVYAPGGRAAYPSSLFMGAVPARVAGVGEVIVCSPPGPDGRPHQVVLAAAALAEVDRVFAIGGAGAIGALAYGTESVPRVDRIVGPGNAWVAEAKLQVVTDVAIDSPAGPSELLVLADTHADVAVVARELVAQAEHDPDAAVVAVIVGDDDADAAAYVERLRATLADVAAAADRAHIVAAALAQWGALLHTASLDDAIAFANAWAAEHLLVAMREAQLDGVLARLRNAGTVFVGASSSVAYGDYMTGANHVLPTAGLARCYSGLSTLDFVRWTSWQRVDARAAASLADDVGRFADAEGLPGHAAAARAWRTDAP